MGVISRIPGWAEGYRRCRYRVYSCNAFLDLSRSHSCAAPVVEDPADLPAEGDAAKTMQRQNSANRVVCYVRGQFR